MRAIYTFPNPILRVVSKDVVEINDEVKALAYEMHEVMNAKDGIGLAAIQVGENYNVITLNIEEPLTLVNPKITEKGGSIRMEEGCLSLPKFKDTIERSSKVTVSYFDLDGEKCNIEMYHLYAVCLQHEMDHLYGVLLLDYSTNLKRSMYEKRARKRGF